MHGAVAGSVAEQRQHVRTCTTHTQGTFTSSVLSVLFTCAHQHPALPGEPLLTRLRALVWLRRSTLRGGQRGQVPHHGHTVRDFAQRCRRCVQLRFGALCAPHLPPLHSSGYLVAHFVVLPNYQEVETLHRETLENLGCSPVTEKHKRTVLTMEGLEGPNTQDKAERLKATTGHSEDVIATCHLSDNAGDVAGKIVQHRFAFRQLWKKYGEEFHQLSSGRDRVGFRPTSEFEFRYWPVFRDVAFLRWRSFMVSSRAWLSVVGLKMVWDQKLSSSLMPVPIMTVHFLQFRFADAEHFRHPG